MIILIIGLIMFLGVHLLPNLTAFRQSLVERWGEQGYKGIFSIISLLGLVLIIIGFMRADFQPVWNPPAWGRHVAMPVMWLALILLPAAHMSSNIKRFTRHPMLWGVVLWSAVHLLNNGDLASIVLFGSFGAYSIIDMIGENRRGVQKQVVKYPLKKDLMVVAAGTLAYVVLLLLHPWLFGVPVLRM